MTIEIISLHFINLNSVDLLLFFSNYLFSFSRTTRRPGRKKKEKYKVKYTESDYLDGSVSETTNLLPAENYLSPDITDGNEPESVLQYAHTLTKDCDSDFGTKISGESSSDSSNSSSSSSSSSSDSLTSSSCDSDPSKVTQEMQPYQIMSPNDCDSSSTSSSDSDSADSTSASSDNSWWQEYEQLKEMQFFKKADAMKDSGYVSTTSPNDSNKIDE